MDSLPAVLTGIVPLFWPRVDRRAGEQEHVHLKVSCQETIYPSNNSSVQRVKSRPALVSIAIPHPHLVPVFFFPSFSLLVC